MNESGGELLRVCDNEGGGPIARARQRGKGWRGSDKKRRLRVFCSRSLPPRGSRGGLTGSGPSFSTSEGDTQYSAFSGWSRVESWGEEKELASHWPSLHCWGLFIAWLEVWLLGLVAKNLWFSAQVSEWVRVQPSYMLQPLTISIMGLTRVKCKTWRAKDKGQMDHAFLLLPLELPISHAHIPPRVGYTSFPDNLKLS